MLLIANYSYLTRATGNFYPQFMPHCLIKPIMGILKPVTTTCELKDETAQLVTTIAANSATLCSRIVHSHSQDLQQEIPMAFTNNGAVRRSVANHHGA